uniref:Nucleoside kinase n=1 Tax=candidate division WOR-3 bacterium TaxID=2052148 RepID=A0A7C4TFM5_UNCW3
MVSEIIEEKEGIEDIKRLNLWRRYQSTLSFILYVAVRRLFPKSRLRIEHSIGQGFYCYLEHRLSIRDLQNLEKVMKEIIAKGIPIERLLCTKQEAMRLFARDGLKDKITLLRNIDLKKIFLYRLLGHYNSFLVPPFDFTNKSPLFYIKDFPPGFVMVFPHWRNLKKLPEFSPQFRLARIFYEYLEWVKVLGITDVGELNSAIKKGRGAEIIRVSEALHEKKIVYIADRITNEKRKIVLIAGPSSAGKTTFTKRLAVQLLVNGLRPLIISVDDYFFPHSKTPRDEKGRLDFESIKAVDLEKLNQDMLEIIEGKRVILPKFNFKTGERERGPVVRLPPYGVVLIEGIHCLNDELTYKIPIFIKFKIYISALTQLNIDDHNRISTTDTRLLRRIVRDTHYRGYDLKGVLCRWGSVRSGEERNIYPFQEQADEMFNSALLYEPAVLKKYCLPILKRIKRDEVLYEEAKRLLDFFTLFNELSDRDVPSNSILREFIGGSSFVY